jgi:hypothetical protein
MVRPPSAHIALPLPAGALGKCHWERYGGTAGRGNDAGRVFRKCGEARTHKAGIKAKSAVLAARGDPPVTEREVGNAEVERSIQSGVEQLGSSQFSGGTKTLRLASQVR